MYPSNLALLPFDQVAKQARAENQRSCSVSHGSLEYVLKNGRHLHDIELGAMEILASRLRQPCLEEFNRGSDAEKEGERDPIFP